MQGIRAAVAAMLASVAIACGSESQPSEREPALERVDLFGAVDPRIGTGGEFFGVGSTYPGPALPFAMIHPSPDTREPAGAAPFYHCAGYYARDTLIHGFSLVHFEGTGVPDYGTIGLMPTLGVSAAKRTAEGRMQLFDKATELARPGHYAVTLADGIRVEITSTRRAALFRFEFPEHAEPALLIDLDQKLEGEITQADIALDLAGAFDAHVQHHGNMTGGAGGYDLYARGELDVAPAAVGSIDETAMNPGQTSASGTPLGAYLVFPAGTRSATLRVAVSFVDGAGARNNLAAEAPSFDFDAMRGAAETEWKAALDRVELYAASPHETTLFATALYHALLMPTLASDADGRFVDALGAIGQSDQPRYTDFSLWDTYRTLHPWLLLSEHENNAHFARTLVEMAAEGGAVPVWAVGHGDSRTMIGSPGEIVLAESALKGVPFDDENAAYDLARVAAYGPSPGPIGGRDADVVDYLERGFVPADVSDGSVAKTQEYAVADAALARWAAKLGRSADADELAARGKAYAAVFDPELGFFRGRNADGAWAPAPEPTAMNSPYYVEGNAWHYLWMVPHDPDGLGELLGGSDAALGRLREFFELSRDETPVLGTRKYYWASNEPDISAPWLFAAWGSPAESQRWVDWALATFYGDGVDGLPGNDDGGTMSAWLLFAAAGLYPLPGTDEYILGVPRQPKLVLKRPSGDLVIVADPAPELGMRPVRVTLDGTPISKPRISHAELTGARVLAFELAPE